jgi:predicted transcriptional regulator of viral defense system
MRKKTLGPVSANLITNLYEKDKVIFTLSDIENITGLKDNAARDLAHKLVQRDIINRIKPGKFIIIPQELGKSSNYLGNWYVIAREIVKSPDYYISFRSAMSIHNMLTHPLTEVYITTPKQEYKKIRSVGNATFEFIYMNKKFIWGIENNWVTRYEKIRVSNIERTVIDCLYCPKYTGGVVEIAKGLWIQKNNINFSKLVSYALTFKKIVVIKRLGYIIETMSLVEDELLTKLKDKINEKYYVLDPLLDTDSTYKNSWKMIANIGPKEIKRAMET